MCRVSSVSLSSWLKYTRRHSGALLSSKLVFLCRSKRSLKRSISVAISPFCKGLLLRKKLSVFVCQAIFAGEDHVLRGFSMPRVRIYITADERRCGRHQQPSVIVFPYQLVRSREVRYHRCPRKTQPGRRRDWCPETLSIFTPSTKCGISRQQNNRSRPNGTSHPASLIVFSPR